MIRLGYRHEPASSIPYSAAFGLGSIVHRLANDGPARIDVRQAASINRGARGQRHLPLIHGDRTLYDIGSDYN